LPWLCVIIMEVLHGIARVMFLTPAPGDFRARQVGVFTGSFLILIVATSSIRWIRPVDAGEAVLIGIVWLVLTLAFEIAFGRFVVDSVSPARMRHQSDDLKSAWSSALRASRTALAPGVS
jgi:hypothetical protein